MDTSETGLITQITIMQKNTNFTPNPERTEGTLQNIHLLMISLIRFITGFLY